MQAQDLFNTDVQLLKKKKSCLNSKKLVTLKLHLLLQFLLPPLKNSILS